MLLKMMSLKKLCMIKVDNIDTSIFILKTKYNTDKSKLKKKVPDVSKVLKKTNYNTKTSCLATKTELATIENKIPSVNNLVTKTDFNTKVTETEGTIPDTTNIANKTALTAVESKIPSASNLVKKSKIIEIEIKINDHSHDEYITTQELNDLTAKHFTARLKQADLVTKIDFDDKLKSFNQKNNSNKTKHLLVEKEINRLKKISKEYIAVKYLSEENGIQNYLVFQLMSKYLKVPNNKNYVLECKSKGISAESVKTPATVNNILNPLLEYDNKLKLKFNRSCLKQDKVTYDHGKIVNIYIVNEISKNYNTREY